MVISPKKRKRDLPRSCGRFSFWKMEEGTAFVVPMTCRRWTCPYCADLMRDEWAHRIAVAGPERLVTITNPGDTAQGVTRCLKLIVRDIRGRGLIFEYWGVVELTKAGRPHIHLLQIGDYIANRMLYHFALSHGAGFTDVRRITSGWSAARYCAKHLARFHGRPAFKRKIRYSQNFFPAEVKAEMHREGRGWGMLDLPPRQAATWLAILVESGVLGRPQRWEVEGAELWPEMGEYDWKGDRYFDRRIRMLTDPDLHLNAHVGNYPLEEEV